MRNVKSKSLKVNYGMRDARVSVSVCRVTGKSFFPETITMLFSLKHNNQWKCTAIDPDTLCLRQHALAHLIQVAGIEVTMSHLTDHNYKNKATSEIAHLAIFQTYVKMHIVNW